MNSFRAFRIHADGKSTRSGFETLTLDQLTPGEVVIRVAYSGINYKDALAATGRGRILRKSPLVGGIDLSGVVVSSDDPSVVEGQRVVVCGGQLSELLDGGYAELARVPAKEVVALPDGLSLRDAMSLGTAGYTAALAVLRMEDNGQVPATGPIAVTGATGGVGSFAINMFSQLGFEICALTRKSDQDAYLRDLGATEVLHPANLEIGQRPLEAARFGGAIDQVGGELLSALTRVVHPWGNIASIGMAGGIGIETTVMPFILRGVSLLGINSVVMPHALRARAWARLAKDLKPKHLNRIAGRELAFEDLESGFAPVLEGSQVGRTVVAIDPSLCT